MNRTADSSQIHWAKGRGDDDEPVNEDGGDGDQDSGEPIPGSTGPPSRTANETSGL